VPDTVTFTDPKGIGEPIELERFSVPKKGIGDRAQRVAKIPEPDPDRRMSPIDIDSLDESELEPIRYALAD